MIFVIIPILLLGAVLLIGYQVLQCKRSIPTPDSFSVTLNKLERVKVKLDPSAKPQLGRRVDYRVRTSSLKKNARAVSDYVAVDVETSGLSPHSNEILSVAAVRFVDRVPTKLFFTYVRPRGGIPSEATRINGITEETVADAPYFEQIVGALSEFIGEADVVAHNIGFDMRFLYHEGLDLGEKRSYYDTLELSRKYDTEIHGHKLVEACSYHHIELADSAHASEADALACGMLLAEYIGMSLAG